MNRQNMNNFITLVLVVLGIALGIGVVEYKQAQMKARADAKAAHVNAASEQALRADSVERRDTP